MKRSLILLACLLPCLTAGTYIYNNPLLSAPTDDAQLYIYDPVANKDRNITWGMLRGFFAPIAPPWASIANKPSVFTPAAHTQGMDTITGLSGALAGKAASTDPRLSDARPPLAHTQGTGTITGLDAALAEKIGPTDPRLTDARTPLAHTQGTDTITGLDAALAGKIGPTDPRLTDARTPLAHTQGTDTITGLDAALADKIASADPRLTDARPPTPHDQPADTITGLADVAINGSYNSLFDLPSIPSYATDIAYKNLSVSDALDQLFALPSIPRSAADIGYGNLSVADALDQLLYKPITITLYTMSGSSSNVVQEIGSSYTLQGSGLYWESSKAPNTQTINGTERISPFTPPGSPFTTNQSWQLYVNDGTSSATATRSVAFTHKRYWGVSASETLTDADIIALSSEFSTSRGQSRSLTAAGQYLWIAYVEIAGAPTITVNGFPDTSWVALVREFVNASGNSTLFRIYRSANPLTGTYSVVVS